MSWPRRMWRLLFQLEEGPTRIALAFAVGVFIAFFPLLGTHTVLALGLAVAFRLNKIAILAGAWINNPWTVAPMYTVGTLVGCTLMGVSPATLGAVDWSHRGRAFFESLIAGVVPLALPFVVGNLVVGMVAAVVSFVALWALLTRRSRRT